MKYIRYLFYPLAFGLGFFAPLIAQILDATGFDLAGINNLFIGLVVGGLWGLMTAYFLSVLGTAIGVYVGRQIAQQTD